MELYERGAMMGNDVCNFFEKVLERQALRVSTMCNPSEADILTIKGPDVPDFIPNTPKKTRKIGY